jgi:hypothetical protein
MTIVLQDRLSNSILKILQNSSEPLETEEILRLIRKQLPNSTRTKVMYRLNNLRADGLVSGKMLGAGKGVWIWWNTLFQKTPAEDDKAWPEEVKALENIQSGRTRMITQGADETIAESQEMGFHKTRRF